VKDPSTGKRQAKPNPSTAWVVENVPELRIVTLQLWQEVKERQQKIRREVIGNEKRVRSERARRPAYLLSGLLRCGSCGGGFSKVSTEHYGCSNARNRGTCTNLLTIRRDVIEATVLSGLKTHLMHPDLTKEFIAEYHRELNRRNAVRDSERELHATELARIDRQIRAIIEAIKDGMRSAAMKDELAGLEQRKEGLIELMRQTPAPVPRLHPNLSKVYRQKVARLQEELNRQELRAEAAEILRSLTSEVRLVPENEKLEVELAGDLAGILALTSGNKKPATDCGGLQVTLVAGGGFEPPTFRL
jgi:site-specific DNA recombinase